MKLEELLEQHSYYRLRDGFTLCRRTDREWMIYWRGKHVDAWEAEHRRAAIMPSEAELTSYPNCIEAVAAATKIKKSAEWFTKSN